MPRCAVNVKPEAVDSVKSQRDADCTGKWKVKYRLTESVNGIAFQMPFMYNWDNYNRFANGEVEQYDQSRKLSQL